MPADLIIYAVVAAGLVFWLRSVLGTRNGSERERPNPFAQSADTPAQVESAMQSSNFALPIEGAKLSLPRNVTVSSPSVEKDLIDLHNQDPQFDIARFCTGAQDAFAIIVEAFAAKDRDTLQNLLEPSVFAAFDQAIKTREQTGETMTTEIHAVRSLDIMNVRLDAKNVYIKVRVIADETCVVRDAEGKILSGDPDRITQMNDVWTFTRAVRSRDPKWLVHETSDGDVVESQKTPVPDAQ